MQALASSRRGVAMYLLVWLLLGITFGSVIALVGDAPFANAMLFALPMHLLYAYAAGYSAYYLCRAFPLGGGRAGVTALVLTVAALASGLLWLALGRLWNSACLLLELRWSGLVLSPQLSALIVGLGFLLYGFAAAVHYLVIEFLRARQAEQRELESLLMAQEAELRMLRAQIDPHFLFNSLNSISALTSQDPQGARRMTLELASFFRLSLGMAAHKKITLEQELCLIQHFLAIEQIRFGTRLQVEQQIEPAAACCLVPAMIIQPLVENAVKHGICHLPEGGIIRLTARRAGSVLHLRVDNPVDVDQLGAASVGNGRANGRANGLGLLNVRQRLVNAYQHEASIHWDRTEHIFGVDIVMPAQAEQAQQAQQGEQTACG